MRTSFYHQPEAQHPNFQVSTSWQADYPIFGSIAPDRYDRDARPMSASPPIAVKHWHRSEPPLRAISCREQSSNIRLQKPDLLDHLVGAQQD